MRHLTGGLGKVWFQFRSAKILLARIYPQHSQTNACDVFLHAFVHSFYRFLVYLKSIVQAKDLTSLGCLHFTVFESCNSIT